MRRKATLLLLTAALAPAARGDTIGHLSIVAINCHSATIAASLDSDWKLVADGQKPAFRIGWDKNPIGTGESGKKTSDLPIFTITGLAPGATYLVGVEARSKRTTGGLKLVAYRSLKKLTVNLPQCTTYVPSPGEVRIRHELTGKCIYGDPNDGGSVRSFDCWRDPNMGFFVDDLGGGEVRLRHKKSGKCVYGSSQDGGVVRNWVCWNDPNMVFTKDDLGGGRVRFRHKLTGKCMYGSKVNGTDVRNWVCWDDPNMVFRIDPF